MLLFQPTIRLSEHFDIVWDGTWHRTEPPKLDSWRKPMEPRPSGSNGIVHSTTTRKLDSVPR